MWNRTRCWMGLGAALLLAGSAVVAQEQVERLPNAPKRMESDSVITLTVQDKGEKLPAPTKKAEGTQVIIESEPTYSRNINWFTPRSGNGNIELRANALFFHRSRPDSDRIVTTPAIGPGGFFVPGNTTLLNADQFNFGWKTGWEVDLVWDNIRDTNWGFQARYFRFGDWFAAVNSGGNSPTGAVINFQQPVGNLNPTSTSAQYTSRLDSFEFNFRRSVTDNVTLLLGYRNAELNEAGGLAVGFNILNGLNTGVSTIRASNHLNGVQVGYDANLFTRGAFALETTGKAGIYHNFIHNEARLVQQPLPPFSSAAEANNTAFIGELGVTGVVQITQSISFRAGYQLLWLSGVATATHQVNSSNPFANFPGSTTGSAQVHRGGDAFYHGATVGLAFTY